MKISLEWISEYVDISDLEPKDIAHKVTMSTAEVEGLIKLKRHLDGVIVGEITSAKKISDKLTYVTVNCGDKVYESVCGAPNVKIGLKSAFAPSGVALAGGFEVSDTELAGHKSEGILCSAKEMGMSEFHEIIFEIPDSVQVGTPLAELIPATDYLLDIDNKSLTHRPDLWGHYGIAREIAAIYGKKLKPMPLEDLTKYDHLPEYKIKIDDLENCPVYCGMEIENLAPVPSPLFMQYRLHALGQRSIDLLVDLTNYILFDLGQPTHAFDGSMLKEVRVAQFGTEGTFLTLDGQERKMLPEDLMIWNEEKPVALAGIMGGEETKVTSKTKKLMLESANFKGSRIRRTATRLNLRSESSIRFEKNQPPINAKIAVARFLYLMHNAGMEPKILTRLSYDGNLKEDFRPLEMPLELFHKRVGMEIPNDRITGILQSIGFTAKIENEILKVGIPPHRSAYDIAIAEDIVEEVSRIYGYDNIKPKMPNVLMKPLKFNDDLRTTHKIRRLLAAGHKFIEVHSYGWFDDRWLAEIGFEPQKTLVLQNSTSEYNTRMKTTLIPNLLADVKLNILHQDSFNLFEISHVYFAKGDDDRIEENHLAGVSFRQSKGKDLEEHFRKVKGAVEDVVKMAVGELPEFTPGKKAKVPWKVKDGYIYIISKGKRIGSLGVLPADVAEKIGINVQVIWFEIELDKLEQRIFPEVAYEPPSIYPGSWLDFSIIWQPAKSFIKLKEKLDKPSVKEFETIKSEIKENCYEILAQLCWLSRVFYSYLDAYKEVIKNNGEEKTTDKTG